MTNSLRVNNLNPEQLAIALQNMRKIWRVVHIGQHNAISLRAISPKGQTPKLKPVNRSFTAADFPQLQARQRAFESEALRLNKLGYNVYIVMNPIHADFGTAWSGGPAVCDNDIDRRTLLLIDIDRATDTAHSATDADVFAAALVAQQVAQYLSAAGWPRPARALSGNGMHLYFRLSGFPNDDRSHMLVTTLLGLLAFKFNTPAIKIDTAVSNASRITKVPGTIARKGSETKRRPFRRAIMFDDRPLTAVRRQDVERVIALLQAALPMPSSTRDKKAERIQNPEADTPRRRAGLVTMLAHISADCGYIRYRDVVWSILGTGWHDAVAIAQIWCMSAPHRFDRVDFDSVVRSFEPEREKRPTVGTIAYFAREGGWNG